MGLLSIATCPPLTLYGYRKVILSRNQPRMLNFCNFPAPVKSRHPETIYVGKAQPPAMIFGQMPRVDGGGGGGGW